MVACKKEVHETMENEIKNINKQSLTETVIVGKLKRQYG